MSIIFQNFMPKFTKISISTWENISVKFWLQMKTQVILIEYIPHIEIMCNSPLGYPKGKRGFPWLVYIRKDSKEESLVVFEIIMKDSNDSFGFGF